MFRAPPFRTRIVPSFYPRVGEMRSRYEEFFANPQQATERHQCINYWFVPDHYAYMRVKPENIIGGDLYADFRNHLAIYARSIGYHEVTGAFLSIYVAGMYQGVHSDMMNGALGWVFSLTRWAERRFSGGETFVAREGVWDRLEPREHRGHASYWEVLPPQFGQLTLFDDRCAHYVGQIAGSLDPLDARIVLHGHIR